MTPNYEKKYIPLAKYFQEAQAVEITLSFEALENILGQPLPNAAYLNSSWWKKTKPPARHFHAWTLYDYYVEDVDLARAVVFKRKSAAELNGGKANHKQDILIIRQAELDDARPLINLQKAVESESDFMLYGDGERQQSVQGIRKMIAEYKKSKKSAFLIALLNGQYAGYLVVVGQTAPRATHRAGIVLGVKEEFQRKGIASALLLEADRWAEKTEISRLELTVVKENEKAIALYKKVGFVVEGTRHHSLCINGKNTDELYMAKLI